MLGGVNHLHLGDCLDVVARVPGASVDLVYVDPPFATGRDHVEKQGAFSDRWESREQFVTWLSERLAAIRNVLKPTGALYVHLDHRASHYVKVALDGIYGPDNFRNELFWRRDVAGKGAKRRATQWPRNVDTILVYSVSKDWWFEQPTRDLTPEQAKAYRHREPDGRRFKTVQLGDYTEASIARMASEGLIHVSATGKRYKKYYLDQARSLLDGLWTDIPGFGTMTASRERLGYPTQKPEALLERIVEASCPPGGVVADFFCGSGTTAAVAQRLGRSWIAGDVSPDAVALTARRLGVPAPGSGRTRQPSPASPTNGSLF
jgi:DNA modification methylase